MEETHQILFLLETIVLPVVNNLYQYVRYWAECTCGFKKKYDTWAETCEAAATHDKQSHGKQRLCNSVIYNDPITVWC